MVSPMLEEQKTKHSEKRSTFWATCLQTLVFYDEPQLILLRHGRRRIIALAIPHEEPCKFFCVTVNDGDWERYRADQLDLLYLFRYAKRSNYYLANFTPRKSDGKIPLTRYEEQIPSEWLPQPRFFASDHTDYASDDEKMLSEKLIYLDGEWELQELGKFQQSISDIYNFLKAIDDYGQSQDDSKRKEIETAFTRRPFEGGSSYGAYFRDLDNRLSSQDRIKLKSIEKASPGKMRILGSESIFTESQEQIENLLENHGNVNSAYQDCHRFLSGKKLLKKSVSFIQPDSDEANEIEVHFEKLSNALNLSKADKELVGDISKNKPLGKVKILLAFCRRVMKTAEFFEQGRASFSR